LKTKPEAQKAARQKETLAMGRGQPKSQKEFRGGRAGGIEVEKKTKKYRNKSGNYDGFADVARQLIPAVVFWNSIVWVTRSRRQNVRGRKSCQCFIVVSRGAPQ
jgi:hypothetical protein